MKSQFLYLSVVGTGSAPTGAGGNNFANVHLLNTDLNLSGGGTGGGGTTINNYYSTVNNSTIYTGGTTSNITQYAGPVIAAGANTQSDGTVIFGGTTGGNVTFGLDTAGNLTASAPGGTAPAGAGTNGAITGGSITVNTSGISINLPAYLTTAQPPGAYLTTAMQSNEPHLRAIVYEAATQTSGTLVLSGSNGITVRSGPGTAIIEFDGHHLDGLIPAGNNFGTGFSSMTSGTVRLSAGQGVSFSQNGNDLVMQVATNYQSQGAYLTTAALSNHTHGNLALTNVSATSASNGLSLSVAAPGGGGGAGTQFSGTNVSGTVDTNGISLSVAAPGGGAGVTFSQYPFEIQQWGTTSAIVGNSGTTGGSTQTTATFFVAPLHLVQNLTFNEIEGYVSNGTSAGTGGGTAGYMLGIYTKNGGSLSLVSSFAFNVAMTQNSVTAQTFYVWWGSASTANSTRVSGNVSANMTGVKNALFYAGGGSLSAGDYILVHGMTARSTSGAGFPVSAFGNQIITSSGGAYFGSTAGASLQPQRVPAGYFSTSSNGSGQQMVMPVSINTTAFTSTGGSTQWRFPYFHFYL